MPAISRVGDIGFGVCYMHDDPEAYVTTIIVGADTVTTNSVPTATISSIGSASCGHTTIANTGSPSVTAQSLGVHRVGDQGTTGDGVYTMDTGSPNTNAN